MSFLRLQNSFHSRSWLQRRVRFDWICDWPNGWYLRGVARRAAAGDLDEFGLFLQMHVRQAVLKHHANSDEYAQLAEGIDQHLKGFYQAFRIHPMEKILSLEAHGMYRLAERTDPALVARFDVGQDAPWDREFHAWSNDWRPTLAVEHFGDCPRDLCEPFVTLKVPGWLKDNPQ